MASTSRFSPRHLLLSYLSSSLRVLHLVGLSLLLLWGWPRTAWAAEEGPPNNLPPTAVLTVLTPAPYVAHTSISVDGTDSIDNDSNGSTAVTCKWFVDNVLTQSTGCSFNWTPTAAGTFTIKLEVRDNENTTTTTEQAVTVLAPPEITLTPATLVRHLDPTQSNTYTVQVTNTGQAALTGVTFDASEASAWLSGSFGATSPFPLAAGASATLTVTLDAGTLAPGGYLGTLELAGDGALAGLGVTLNVNASAVLTTTPAAPARVERVMTQGSPTPVTGSITVANTVAAGGATLNVTAVTVLNAVPPQTDWLTFPAAGSGPITFDVAPGAHHVLGMDLGTSTMVAGTYTADVRITSNGGTSTVPVQLVVETAPTLEVAPLVIDETLVVGESRDVVVLLDNGGAGTLDITSLSESPAASWLSWSPAASALTGISAAQSETLTVTLQALSAGTHTATLNVSASTGQTVPISVTMQSLTPPAIDIVPLSYGKDLNPGQSFTQAVEVVNTGQAPLAGMSVVIGAESSWLSASFDPSVTFPVSGGGSVMLDVTVDAGSWAAGTYQGGLELTADGLVGVSDTLPVTMTVKPSAVLATAPSAPAGVARVMTAGSATPATGAITLTNAAPANGAPLNVTAVTVVNAVPPQTDWVTFTTATTGSWEPGLSHVLGMDLGTSTLPAGTYTADVQIASNGGTSLVPVQLTVQDAPVLALSAASVTATREAGQAETVEVAVTVSNQGEATLVVTDLSATPPVSWLTLSTSTFLGIASNQSETLTLTFDASTLATNTYTTDLVFSSNGGNVTVPVTFSVTPAAVTLTSPADQAGAVASAPPPSLVWQPSAGADTYTVQVASDAGFTSVLLDVSTTATNHTPTAGELPLEGGRSYHWRVKAVNTVGASAWRSASFTTAAPAAVLGGPSGNVASDPVAFSWSLPGVSGISGGTLQIYTGTQGSACSATSSLVHSAALGSTVTSASVAGSTFVREGFYCWRVMLSYTGGGSGLSGWGTFSYVPVPANVVVTNPVDGATGVASTPSPQLEWAAAAGADTYTVQLASDAGFTVLLLNASGITATSQTAPALNAGQTYHWRVRGVNVSGPGAWTTASFTTDAPAAALSVPLANAIVGGDASAAVAFSWSLPGVSGISGVTLEIDDGTTCDFAAPLTHSASLGSSTASTSVAGSTFTRGAYYCWRVAVSYAGGALTPSAGQVFRYVPVPADVVVTSPVDGATHIASTPPPQLVWTAAAGADTYTVQLASDAGFTALLLNTTGITGTSQTAPTLNAGQTYHWRVQGVNVSGPGAWTTASFTTASPPGSVTLTSPADGATGVASTPPPQLVWTAAAGADTYTVQVASDAGFTVLLLNTNGLSTTSYTPTAAALPLNAGQTYHWRVKAVNTAGESAWSSASFTTDAPAAALSVPLANAIVGGDASAAVAFSWSLPGVSGISGVTLEIDDGTTCDFAAPLAHSASLGSSAASTSVAGSTFTRGAYYCWRVAVSYAGGALTPSAGQVFRYVPVPADVVVTSPVGVTVPSAPPPPFIWSAAAGAESYGLQVSTSSTFASLLLDVSGLTVTSHSPTAAALPLQAGQIYHWRVQGVNVSGPGAWTTASFTTASPPGPMTAPSISQLTATDVTLSWSAEPVAEDYTLELTPYADTGYSSAAVQRVTGLTGLAQTIAIEAGRQYRARVQARNAEGAGPFSGSSIFTSPTLAAANTAPADQAVITTTTVPLAWSLPAVSGIQEVRVEVEAGTACSFAGTLAYQSAPLAASATDLSLGAGDLTAGASYCWRVVLGYADATSSSAGTSFTYQPVVPTPQLTIVDEVNVAPGLCAGAMPLDQLTIRNDGSAALTWGIAVNPDPVWFNVSYNTAEQTLSQGASATIDLTVFEASIPWGSSPSATLTLTTNDPGGNRQWTIAPVALGATLASVTPASFPLVTLAPGESTTRTLSLTAGPCGVSALSVSDPTSRPWLTIPALPATLTAHASTNVVLTLTADALGLGGHETVQLAVGPTASGTATPALSLQVPIPQVALTAPTDGATQQPIQPLLQWQGVTGAASYDVQVSIDPAFATVAASAEVAHDAQASTQTWSVPAAQALAANQSYSWRARIRTATAAGPWSSVRSLTTADVLAAPVLSQPLAGEAYAPVQPSLSWGAVAGALSYRVEVAGDAAFTSGLQSQDVTPAAGQSTPPTSATWAGLLSYDAAYYWRVVVVGASGETASEARALRTHYAPPAGLTPLADAVSVPLERPLCWEATPVARPGVAVASYQVRLSYEAEQADGTLQTQHETVSVAAAAEGGETCWEGPALGWLLGTAYTWAVRAVDDTALQDDTQGKGAWSTDHLFTATPFDILTPVADEQWLPGSTQTVTWNSAAAQGTRLRLVLVDAQGGDTVINPDAPDTGTLTWTVGAALTPGRYTLQISRTDNQHEAISAPFFIAADGQVFGLVPREDTYDFGSVPEGYRLERTYTLTNPGSDTLAGTIALSGAIDFALTVEELSVTTSQGAALTSFNYEVEPGRQLQFAVVYAPVAASGQGRTATLALTHNDQEWAVTGAMVHEIAVSGEVTAFGGGPRLVAQPATDVLSYGVLAQGYRLVRRLTLSNTGTAALTGIVEVAGETGADEGNWQLEQGGNIVADGTALDLAPGESQMLDVVFAPQAIGETAATFRYVHSDSQYPGGTSLEVALSGEGVGAQDGRHLTLAPEYGGLSFGSSAAGDTLVQMLTVSNALAASEALSVWLDLSDQVNYAVQVNGVEITYNQLVYGGDPGAPHLVLVPGASAEVRVLYKPQSPGEHVSSVHIRHDDSDYHPEEVLVTVWGVGTDGARKRYYYLSDHLGSVRATVNETGEVLHHEDYYPFGLTMPGRSMDNGNKAARERYTGHELDEETDLYYAGARYLDPVIGRWNGTDPLADDYPSLSPYNYVANNPIVLIDPDGREIRICQITTTTGDDGNETKGEECHTYIPGEQYEGDNDSYIGHVVGYLNDIWGLGDDDLNTMIQFLVDGGSDSNVHTIRFLRMATSLTMRTGDSNVTFDHKGEVVDEAGNKQHPALALFHELVHSFDTQGRTTDRSKVAHPSRAFRIPRNEVKAVAVTNIVRGYLRDYEPRTTYGYHGIFRKPVPIDPASTAEQLDIFRFQIQMIKRRMGR